MNFHWTGSAAAAPIIEYHDVRIESGSESRYLELLDELGSALGAAGVADLGRYRVASHPQRVVLLRGYSSMAARRQSIAAFHASPQWCRHRQEMALATRESAVSLTRTITPESGLMPIPAAEVSLVVSELLYPEQIGDYHLWLRLLLRKAGLDPLAALATLEAVNDAPSVPVIRHRSQHVALLPAAGNAPDLPPELRAMLRFAPETLRLEPARALVW